ncbi:efflux transporter, RND family, MFP subunit [Gemmatirosa kalamazoonensis]|uniref:Efflux transporter, RND family, MFP subunit n=1 Tax=Gemmatirosa kalamazoonensis TaxID=861299 RepID=W0RM32_9BACT|nr:efflux RND transporter periplasmic adaptor subunit [Gemmatirosa kalamazoonensis]AHG91806.1 efflux transporter, RND family, MFP subunit [Gemmatirosa kalamazoonensis]
MSAPPPSGRGARRLLPGAGAFFVVLLFVGAVPRLRRKQALEARTHAVTEAPLVSVVTVKRASASGELLLPGTVQAMREAALYARSSGYVRRFHADIGSRVRAGQLLAEIETPELDQELAQARASLGQVRAAHALARTSLDRWRAMVKDSAATRQELDEKEAGFEAASANLAAGEANVRRLQEMQSFGRVVAPFAGTVTARNVEVGQLVSPAQGGGARPLFVLAQADTGRVMINVPEAAAAQLHPGSDAEIVVQSLGGARFTGRVVRTSGAVEAATRTMLAEVDVPNPNAALLPGMYAQVRLAVRNVTPGVLLPANALVSGPNGPQVALLRGGRVHFTKVELGRDFGTEIEVLSGLDEGATVVVNPSDAVAEGIAVRAVRAEKP